MGVPTTAEPAKKASELQTVEWEAVAGPARAFVKSVASRLEEQTDAFEPEIAGYAKYALSSQGKQIRPVLVGLSGQATGELNADHVTLAVVIEMIHLATLVHDDIMDRAELRRGQATLASRWGNEVSVLLGDCLFAQALKLSTDFPTADISRAVAESTRAVCSGEILQTHRRRRWNLPRAEYLKVLEMKTAELFALACEMGAKISGASAVQMASMRRYGIALGTAYQIYDDCLDLYGVEDVAGKSLGTDLISGKLTLPILIYLERASPAERAELIGWLTHWQPSQLHEVRERLARHDALGASRQFIEGLLQTARESVADFKPSLALEALNNFPSYLSQRIRTLGV